MAANGRQHTGWTVGGKGAMAEEPLRMRPFPVVL